MIPMPILGKDNLCLSIVRLPDGNFSVMAAELTNGFGDPVPAEYCLYPINDTEDGDGIFSNLLPEYGSWQGPDLEEVIRRTCVELKKHNK